MVSALKSFHIYTHLFLAVHIANVSGFSFVITHAVIPILQREKRIGGFFFVMLIWKVDIKRMGKTPVRATFIIYRGTWFSPL